MAKHEARFIEGAKDNNVSPNMAERLFALMEKFGGYGFNKSHSAAYAMIAYQTAYLKAHYPVPFMTALLTLDMGNQDKTIKNIAECRDMGIEILPPDVNESQADFSIVEDYQMHARKLKSMMKTIQKHKLAKEASCTLLLSPFTYIQFNNLKLQARAYACIEVSSSSFSSG